MKYVPSLMVGQLSRSAGSTTASRNRGGSYFRTRVMPVNPNTTAQGLERQELAGLSESWRALSLVQKQGWISLGAQIVRTDSLGQPYTLTGLQCYTSINRNLSTIGVAQVVAAPTIAAVPGLTSLTLTADASPATLSLAYAPTVPANTVYVIDATPQVSNGRFFVPRSLFRQLTTLPAATASPADILALYTARYGALISGGRIFVRVRAFSTTGFASPPLQTFAVVVP